MQRAAALVAASALVAQAQLYPPPHPDVRASWAIIGGRQLESLPVREPVRLVCGIVNDGDVPFNVSGIMATLNNPLNYAQVYANLSGVPVGEIVEPGGEMTVEYVIRAPEMPEYPFAVQLAATVFYEDADEVYANTFFNETVAFAAPTDVWKAETLVPPALGVVAIILALAFFLDATPTLKSKMATAETKPVEKKKEVVRDVDEDESFSALPARSSAKKKAL